jgi:hypothetical protein
MGIKYLLTGVIIGIGYAIHLFEKNNLLHCPPWQQMAESGLNRLVGFVDLVYARSHAGTPEKSCTGIL